VTRGKNKSYIVKTLLAADAYVLPGNDTKEGRETYRSRSRLGQPLPGCYAKTHAELKNAKDEDQMRRWGSAVRVHCLSIIRLFGV